MRTDEELMLTYREGDGGAFEELYRRYRSRVYGYLQNKVPTGERDDVFQKIFLKLHHKRFLYNQEYQFAPWFFTLCRHVIIDHYRLKKVDLETLSEKLSLEEHESIDKELPPMSDEQFKLLYMKFVEGRGYKELEVEFNSSASSLRKRVSRLLASLRGDAKNE